MSWMLAWLLARLSCSACSGVTSRFTTCTMIGLPSASFLKSCRRKAPRCSATWSWSACPGCRCRPGVPEIRTSTCMPDTTNPDTPTTSFTRIATARMPCGSSRPSRLPRPWGRGAIRYRLPRVNRRGNAAPHHVLRARGRPGGDGAGPILNPDVFVFQKRAHFRSFVASTIRTVVRAALAVWDWCTSNL